MSQIHGFDLTAVDLSFLCVRQDQGEIYDSTGRYYGSFNPRSPENRNIEATKAIDAYLETHNASTITLAYRRMQIFGIEVQNNVTLNTGLWRMMRGSIQQRSTMISVMRLFDIR